MASTKKDHTKHNVRMYDIFSLVASVRRCLRREQDRGPIEPGLCMGFPEQCNQIKPNADSFVLQLFLTMFSCLPTLGVLLLVTAGKVTSVDDFDLACPPEWTENNEGLLLCTIPVNKFSSSSPCGIYGDSVAFTYTKDGTTNTDCTVVNIDTVCDNSSNSDGCGCREKNATHLTVFDKVVALKVLHEHAEWECKPQCLTTTGLPVLSGKNTTECFRTSFASPCKNTQCERDGICEVFGTKPKCNCNGTYHTGSTCEVDPCENKTKCCVTTAPHTAHIIEDSVCIEFIIVVVVCPPSCVGALLWHLWFKCKKKFSSVICAIVCVDTEQKKRTLQSVDTKKKVQRFISKHYTLYCCCCCSWLGRYCSGGLIWKSNPGDDDDDDDDHGGEVVESDGVAVESGMGCNMCCVWCLSAVNKVEVEVYCIEDKRALVLITLESSLSWYADAKDMPAKVKEYIRTKILKEHGKERSHTSKPSMCLSLGCIAGSPDPCDEPPADYPPGAPKAQAKYTGNENSQPKKSKSDKAIPLSSVGRSSPPSETSGDENTHMIPSTKGRALPVPANQHEPTSTGIGKSASPRLDPLTRDHNKMPSVERNSGAFPRTLPSPGQPPLDPIPSGKKS